MNAWEPADIATYTTPEEVELRVQADDGSLEGGYTIWDVAVGDRVFIRSAAGTSRGWYRQALKSGVGALTVGRARADVRFTPANESDLDAVDAAYRSKYANYASIVDSLLEPAQREATLEVRPV